YNSGTLNLTLTDFFCLIILNMFPKVHALAETTMIAISLTELCADLADTEEIGAARIRVIGLEEKADPFIRKQKPEVDEREEEISKG
ncbi:uncharacterized protein K452DRAFT_303816, partial [Aplosporella prunicola CBS 121167]